jgi:hypothetical protein
MTACVDAGVEAGLEGGIVFMTNTTSGIDRVIVERGRSRLQTARPEQVTTPLIAALQRAGTEHLYGDTADTEELATLLAPDGSPATAQSRIRREIDGNTANQPLIRKVVEHYLETEDVRGWAKDLDEQQPGLARPNLLVLLYTILCGRIGNDMSRRFAAGRVWEVSLQLHMDLRQNAEAARSLGRVLRRCVPHAIVKVPFAPEAPDCLLVARDLERAGIPVNFTSTFSARQAVVAALLADVTRTNIFMGRLNQGLQAEQLGEHVDLAAQRAIRKLRDEDGVKTRLIVASVRDWQTFVRVAGCDVFTAPCSVIQDFIEQQEIPPDGIENRLETSYEDDLGISEKTIERTGPDAVARLYHVETELVEFLRELRGSRDYARIEDGEQLFKRFDEAGFGSLFHDPSPAEREELARGKLPELDGELIGRIPLDTHFSLLANADFARNQSEIDARLERSLDGELH